MLGGGVENGIYHDGTLRFEVKAEGIRYHLSGAVHDGNGDFGDGIFAVESDLLLDQSTLTGNAGTGATLLRSALQAVGTELSANGRAGIWLIDRSSLRATGNRFDRNRSGVEVGAILAQVTLSRLHERQLARFSLLTPPH